MVNDKTPMSIFFIQLWNRLWFHLHGHIIKLFMHTDQQI